MTAQPPRTQQATQFRDFSGPDSQAVAIAITNRSISLVCSDEHCPEFDIIVGGTRFPGHVSQRHPARDFLRGLNHMVDTDDPAFVECWRTSDPRDSIVGRGYSDKWSISGRLTPYFHSHPRVPGRTSTLTYLDPVEGEYITVRPGAHYHISGRFGVHRCRAEMMVEVFSPDGEILLTANRASADDMLGGARVRRYSSIGMTFAIPDKGVVARISLKKTDLHSEGRSDSLLLFSDIVLRQVAGSGEPGDVWQLSDTAARAALRTLDVRGALMNHLPVPRALRDGNEHTLLVAERSTGHRALGTPLSFKSPPPPNAVIVGSRMFPDAVIAGIASIPKREALLRNTIEALAPQVDHIVVYLNNYSDTPSWLNGDNLTVKKSQEFGDLRDNGKFFGLSLIDQPAYYLTCDDDLSYPSDYVYRMIERVRHYRHSAVVGVHGVIYAKHPTSFFSRTSVHFAQALTHDLPVSAVGTGTAAFHTSTISPDVEDLGAGGMADLKLGALLKGAQIPSIAVSRPPGWLTEQRTAGDATGESLYHEARNSSGPTEFLKINAPWGFQPILKSTAVVEDRISAAAYNLIRLGLQTEGGDTCAEDFGTDILDTVYLAEQVGWQPLAALCLETWVRNALTARS